MAELAKDTLKTGEPVVEMQYPEARYDALLFSLSGIHERIDRIG